MTIKRICDKCGKEEKYDKGTPGHGLHNSQDVWWDLCKECSDAYNEHYNELFTELENKMDAWLKGK